MRKLLMDNWRMIRTADAMCSHKETISECYADLLMSIALWDEVCYPDNINSQGWIAAAEELKAVMHPIDDTEHVDYWNYGYTTDVSVNLEYNARKYLELCIKNGMDYLPAPQRLEYLKRGGSSKSIQEMLTRLKMQEHITEEVREYYSDTYKAILDFSCIDIQMPVLAKFIIDSTPPNMTPIDYACHLREEGPVIKYREYLDEVQNALEEQNMQDLRYLIRCSDDAVEGILKMDKKVGKITVGVLPIPSIYIEHKYYSATLSPTPSFSISGIESKRFNLTFLREIAKYARDDMKLL